MIRAQLIELTALSCIRSRNATSLNIAFTRSWQSSNVPSIATTCTLGDADGRHLPALHVAGATVGIQDDDVDVGAVLHAVDRRRTGVATGGTDDGHPPTLLGQHVVEQPADQLQRDVLERQGRAVEELLDEVPVVDLDERHDGGMGERRVRLPAQVAPARRAAMSSPTNGAMTCAARSA